MALSGNFSTNEIMINGKNIGLNLTWTGSQNLSANTTTISWTLKSFGNVNSTTAHHIYLNIEGTRVLDIDSNTPIRGGGWFKRSGTITISHGTDGSKRISMTINALISSSTCQASRTYTLDNIPRYATLSVAPNFTDEENPTISFNNYPGTSVVTNIKITLWLLNHESEIGISTFDIPQSLWGGGNYTIVLTASQHYFIEGITSLSKTITVQYDLQSTRGGTVYHDYKSATVTIVNANPTVGALSYQDTNSTVSGITGSNQIIVQKQSTLQIHAAASSANKQATISSTVLTFNGTNYTPDGSGNVTFTKPNLAGTYTATLKVTDSRGYSASRSLSIPITAWKSPTAKCSLYRVDGYKTDCLLKVIGTISVVKNLQDQDVNAMYITEEHQSSGGSWSSPTTVPNNTTVTITNDLVNTKTGTVKVKIWDKFTTSSPTIYTLTVGKGSPIAFFDVDKLSVGVHGFPDGDGQLYVGGQVKATDGMVVPATGQSYVNPTHKSAVYVPKSYQTNQWFPFAMTQTYNGGQWSIGNYNNEELLFIYTTKYNVDHNVNTNQMWRLQLAKNDNSSADNKIITSNNFTSTNTVNTNTLSEVFVRSSGGTAIEAAFRRWGKVCTLYLHFKTTATTSGGGNMIVGKAGSAVTPYLPPMIVTSGSYYSSMALGGHLGSDGSITVRNASSSNIGAQSSGFRMTWTWVY